MEGWYQQDILRLSTEEWKNLLQDNTIFHDKDIEMVLFVYYQENHQSTATEIGYFLDDVHPNQITAQNRAIAKRIYKFYEKQAPPNDRGGKRYWNVIFDGNKDMMVDQKGHWIWAVRPDLVKAISEVLTSTHFFDKYCSFDNKSNTETDLDAVFSEGNPKIVQSRIYERNPIARRICIGKKGCVCSICGFNFGNTYGSIAEGKIHVHHVVPLSDSNDEHKTDPMSDLIPICPNCHYVIHLKTPSYSPEEIRKLL